MAASDARPIPLKGVAFRALFEIRDGNGAYVTGGTGLAAIISKDQGTAVSTTNAPVEIATATGMYYIDFTSSEMNADGIAVRVTATNSGAKPTGIYLYPQEADDIKVSVTHWLAEAVAVNTAGIPKVDATLWKGETIPATNITGVPKVDPTHFRGDAIPAMSVAGVLKVDITHLAGSVLNPSTAQIGAAVIANGDKAGYSLSAAGNNAAADALLDRANAIEVGITPRLALRYIGATTAGKCSGADTTTVRFKGIGVDTERAVYTTDASGNRSDATLS